ncbi:hypothetical protein [Shewanella chilikensis]|nr:hypothetical protein [Shewanella chilikensis]
MIRSLLLLILLLPLPLWAQTSPLAPHTAESDMATLVLSMPF